MTSRLISVPLLLVATAGAQSFIVPSAHATNRPSYSPFYVSSVFYSTSSTTIAHDSHSQSFYDMTDITLPAAQLRSLDIRRPASNAQNTYLGNNNPATTTNAVIQLAFVPTPLASVTNTFANNLGANPTMVFNGMLNLPARNGTPNWPAPWENVPFSTPMTFVRLPTGVFVVDILQTNNSATSAWYLEAQLPFNGDRQSNGNAQSNCKFSNGNYNSSLGYTQPRVGGTWYVSYGSLLPNVSGFAWIGTQGIGGTWGSIPLPIDLTPFGAPSCGVNASVDYVVPLTADANGSARWPTIQIPNDPSLGRAVFFDHSAWLDAQANAFGVVTGWSSKWTIGDGVGAPAALLTATGNSAMNPTGTLQMGAGVTMQFNQ
jgi:hypothetical protein